MPATLERIMRIDDDEPIVECASMTIEAAGFELLHCESRQQGIEQVPNFQPQLILLDAIMPGRDGKAAYHALREFPAAATLPIVFMTDKTTQQNTEEFLTLGALSVIGKPFDTGTLCTQINTLWQQRSAP